MKLIRKARPAGRHLSGGATEAWWYENAKSVDVFVRLADGGVGGCRIPRAQLADWLKRTETP